ncbi:lys-63-specific deubiquitinase BRCC36 [Neodiprion pinetum]|uniref:lys-63-specific deubiquitinase BRCC36-like n=1 Tax=Neodiprion fabricii TaxID=2872261 RepID=UPI001ED97777|nr:lys-63-specific deubiquitinase BRCC36-like [Neodiprion fabricii]XP_046477623.1 lys-63-specific deubiquitinase BRCC36-like [Neodiprion pinetum]XP_046477624.1 lys-63-specific deubiquitinase BRCC36-like [Neodiprion pinetum]XP_046614819.1 lys-63-specific deubiquitinase BRCC36-like [Neodiprion virginianus]
MEVALHKVELHADVYMVCLQHALSTENFEVMGLLIGNLESGIANVSAVKILRRSDKKKDRVEISSEQVLKAAAEAERLTIELNRPMRVLGWYHSHPHITVWPSHVDVRTQATYQTMDHGFVGLIFSVFSEGKDSKEQEALVTCFQSHNGEATEIPLEILYTPDLSEQCLKTMTDLPKILVQEEEDSAEACKNHPDLMATIHNRAVHTRALAHITDIVTRPLVSIFETRLALNKTRATFLQKQLAELQNMCTESMKL